MPIRIDQIRAAGTRKFSAPKTLQEARMQGVKTFLCHGHVIVRTENEARLLDSNFLHFLNMQINLRVFNIHSICQKLSAGKRKVLRSHNV